jgi:hypothetical protein
MPQSWNLVFDAVTAGVNLPALSGEGVQSPLVISPVPALGVRYIFHSNSNSRKQRQQRYLPFTGREIAP